MNQYEREYEQLEKDRNQGLLTDAEFNKQVRELERFQQEQERQEREEAHERLDYDMGWR